MTKSWLRSAAAAVAVSAAALLGGCGGIDGVELKGGVFDALGISSDGNSGPRKDAQVAARPGIILPPQADKLPQPGSGTTTASVAQTNPAWPVDADGRRIHLAAELDKQHAAFCDKALFEAKSRGQPATDVVGPKGPCAPSLLRSMGMSVSGDSAGR